MPCKTTQKQFEKEMTYTFKISDETVNSYGTRVLTTGIGTGNYLKNPIVLWNHTRSWSDKNDQVLPIGKCIKLWEKAGELFAEIELDETDDFAEKIARKIGKGIISACSISLDIITTSENPKTLIQGQTRPTIIESSLREISIVDLPANKSCVKLYDQGCEINFSDSENEHFLLPLLNTKNMNFKEEVQGLLNLKEGDENQVIIALKEVIRQNKEAAKLKEEHTTLSGQLDAYELKEKEAHTAKIASLVDEAIKSKKILASQKETYISLAEKDFTSTESILSAMATTQPLQVGEKETATDAWGERFREINKN